MKKESNKKFYKTKKVQAELDAYFRTQKAKANLWRDTQQYERYKARLGTRAVPSFKNFRNMKKSNSDKYTELQAKYRDKGIQQRKEYEEHTST